MEKEIISSILTPKNRFFERYFEKRPLLSKAAISPTVIAQFNIRKVINERFKAPDLNETNLRLAKRGEPIFDRRVYSSDLDTRFAALNHYYSNGTTIIVEKMDQCHLDSKRIAAQCEKALAPAPGMCSGQVNYYVTPANSIGFGCHYDLHDVVVVQLFGSKRWKIWDKPFYLPYSRESFFNLPAEAQEELRSGKYREIVLREGDILYLPRGYLHEVCTADEESIHMTIGLQYETLADVFEKRFARSSEDILISRSLFQNSRLKCYRRTYTPKDQAKLLRMKELFEQVKGKKKYQNLVALMKAGDRSSQHDLFARPSGPIGLQDRISWRSNALRAAYIKGDKLILYSLYRKMILSVKCLGVLTKLARESAVEVSKLFPRSREDSLTLANALFDLGLIERLRA